MSCIAATPRFRLLDALVGWDAAAVENLVGLDAGDGVRLAGDPAALTLADIDPFIPPPRLAPGCGPCDWYLATGPWPVPRLLSLNSCNNRWTPVWPEHCAPFTLVDVSAIAFDRDLLAIADRGAGRVWVLTGAGHRTLAEIAAAAVIDLSFGPEAALVIAAGDGTQLTVHSVGGRSLGDWPAALPAGKIERLAHDRTGGLWLVLRQAGGRLSLWRQSGRDPSFAEANLAALTAAFTRTALRASSIAGFVLERGLADLIAWDWAGRPLAGGLPPNVGPTPPDRYARHGQLLTLAIDSGIEHCRWHRVRIEADVPPRTAIELAVASNASAAPAAQGAAAASPWNSFAAGLPHPGDWQTIAAGADDALIMQPAGRYLFVRLRLSGDGQATPRVSRIRLDLPRATSADLLPAIYREEPRSADFTERFLALFDAGAELIEQTIARLPAAIDVEAADPELLPWVAGIVGLAFDPAWDVAARRRLLGGAPELYRRRGTPAGLALALELVSGDARPAGGAVIEEHGLARSWATLGGGGASGTLLSQARLFSRAQGRIKLGASQLGTTPVLSYGNPDEDPLETGAFRFSVTLPIDSPISEATLRALVESQKPAHTLAEAGRGRSGGFVIDGRGRLGIDTELTLPPPGVLGAGALRLGANSIVGGAMPRGPVMGLAASTLATHSNARSICT